MRLVQDTPLVSAVTAFLVVDAEYVFGEKDVPVEKEIFLRALYDFAGETDKDLAFSAGDKIKLLEKDNEDWYLPPHTHTHTRRAGVSFFALPLYHLSLIIRWSGELNGVRGLFPSNYVKQLGGKQEFMERMQQTRAELLAIDDRLAKRRAEAEILRSEVEAIEALAAPDLDAAFAVDGVADFAEKFAALVKFV